jgi:hypothetical protein
MKQSLKVLLPLLLLTLFSTAARADSVILTITNPNQTAFYNTTTTLSFFATVSAPITNTGTEFLNGDSLTLSGPATLDDSPFLNNYPLDLTPGQSFSGLLFTVVIHPGSPISDYAGFFDLQGGANGNSANVLDAVPFSVNVTPEPGSLPLLCTGVAALWTMYRRRSVRV